MNEHHSRFHLLDGYKRYMRKFPHVKLALTAIFVSVFICVALILRIIAHEMPRAWVDKIEEELSTDTFSVELDGVSLSIFDGLFLNNLSIYPKGITHEPIINATQVHIGVDFFSFKPLPERVKFISVDKLELNKLSNEMMDELGAKKQTKEEVTILPKLNDVDITCNEASILGVDVSKLQAKISMTESKVSCDSIDLLLTEPSERFQQKVTGSFEYDVANKNLEFLTSGQMKTETIIPLFDNLRLFSISKELNKISFPEAAPDIVAKIKCSPNEELFNFDLGLNSKYVVYNGVDFTSLSMNLRAYGTNKWSNVDIVSLVGYRPEGVLRGSISIDLDKYLLTYNAFSEIRPAHLLTAIGIIGDVSDFPLDVELPCQIDGSGCVGISKETVKALKVVGNIEARSISFKGNVFENSTGRINMDYDSWNIDDIKASFYEGNLDGKICVTPQYVSDKSLSLESVNFAADFSCADSKFNSILHSLDKGKKTNDTYPGIVKFNGYLNFDIAKGLDSLQTMKGAVNLDIVDALIYRVPIFAGFTDFMVRNVPGVDFLLTQSSLKTELIIKDYGAHFDSLVINGPVLSVTGYGDIWFTNHVDAHVRVNLLSQDTWVGQGLSYLLFPISKIFELQAYGPVNKLVWTSNTLSLGGKETTPEQRGENE